jgi:hypothetical protein
VAAQLLGQPALLHQVWGLNLSPAGSKRADLSVKSWRRGWDSNPRILRSAVFKFRAKGPPVVADGRFTLKSAVPAGLESAGFRPCCYRLLLPVDAVTLGLLDS